jgi:hypothetical protein
MTIVEHTNRFSNQYQKSGSAVRSGRNYPTTSWEPASYSFATLLQKMRGGKGMHSISWLRIPDDLSRSRTGPGALE